MNELEKESFNILQCMNYKKLSDEELRKVMYNAKLLFYNLLNEYNSREIVVDKGYTTQEYNINI